MTRKVSRRDVLKASVAATFGAMLLPSGLLVHGQSPNEKLNVACIGIGGQGNYQLNGISNARENIVALCDVDTVRAGNAYERFPSAKKFTDYRKMFDEIEKEIDAVAISTPDHSHYHPVMRALRAGKHVYCEKPLAHSVAECRIITDTAAEKKLATQLGCQRHTHASIHRVVELVKKGAIGEVREVHCWYGGTRGMPEKPTKFVNPPATLEWDLWLGPAADRKYSVSKALNGKEEGTLAPYNWRFWWDYGTGETGNWSCHILDIPYWALDLKYPNKVSAAGPEVDPERTPKEMLINYEFPARGDLPPVTLSWSHTTKPACKEKYKIPDTFPNKLSFGAANTLFVGSKGMILCGFDRYVLLPEKDFVDFTVEKFIPDSPGFHKEWIAACKGGEPATCNFAYSGPMAETAILGNTAYKAGRKSFAWDAAKLQAVDCPEVQALIKPEFKKGWEY